jgi:hypothetical protein
LTELYPGIRGCRVAGVFDETNILNGLILLMFVKHGRICGPDDENLPEGERLNSSV